MPSPHVLIVSEGLRRQAEPFLVPGHVPAMNRERGFTLIELMVVVMIIGVLGAIAVPMYADHASRSQVARAHSELSAYARSTEAFVALGTEHTIDDDPVDALGFTDSSLTTTTFGTFDDAATSTITAIMDGASSAAVRGATIELARGVDGTWTCTVTPSASGWKDQFRPPDCL